MMLKRTGFSLVEVLMIFLITSILILASYPALTKKKVNEARNTNVIQCIEKEGAASLTTSACSASINGGVFNMANYLDTLISYVDGANSTQSTNASKILRAVCDQGGKLACDRIINRCANDINKCEQTYDLKYYLTLLTADSNMSKVYFKKVLTTYYNVNMLNIKTEVDKWCCNPDINLACDVKNVFACTPAGPPDPACGATTIGSIKVSNCNNALNPVANGVDPYPAGGCWLGASPQNSSYCVGTGCNANKTLCNYAAAVNTCSALNGGTNYGTKEWRLPNNAELDTFGAFKVSLDLCDGSSSSPLCKQYDGCIGSTNDDCIPSLIWSTDIDGNPNVHYTYHLWNGTWGWAIGPNLYAALSVRCVRSL